MSFQRILVFTALILLLLSGCRIKNNNTSSETPTVPPDANLGSIEGTVMNSKTREPLEGATVELEKTKISAVTEKDGKYSLKNFPGTFTIIVKKDGYRENTRTREISAGESITENILLIPVIENTPVAEETPTPSIPAKPVLLTTNYYSNEVMSIDLEKNKLKKNIAVGKEPEAIAICPKLSLAYVANSGDNTISVIEYSKNLTLRGHITVDECPKALAVTDSALYVANNGSDNISVIDLVKNQKIKTISTGKKPAAIVIDKTKELLYVMNSRSNNISVISYSFNTVIKTIKVGKFPCSGAVSPKGKYLYVVNEVSKDLIIVDTDTEKIKTNIPLGSIPKNCLLTPDGTKLYITNYQDNTVTVINCLAEKIIKTIEVGENPSGLAFLKSRNRLYVANGGSNSISIIDVATDTITGKITEGNFPYNMVISQ